MHYTNFAFFFIIILNQSIINQLSINQSAAAAAATALALALLSDCSQQWV